MEALAIVVGDEILAGHIRDANTSFIAARLSALGHRLRRVVVVGDEPASIADEVARGLLEGADLVFVCGGLGPTHDDRTAEGVATALGLPLVLCAPLAERIESLLSIARDNGIAAALGAEGLRKMALAPAGAELLSSSQPVMPAFALQRAGTIVLMLPGPPQELQRVFIESVEPRYLEQGLEPPWREELTHTLPESALAETLDELARRFRSVAIGSYPQSDHVVVRVTGDAEEATAVAARIRQRLLQLEGSEEGLRLRSFLERDAR